MESARALARRSRKALRVLRQSAHETRNKALLAMADRLQQSAAIDSILEANAKDLDAARHNDLAPALQERLMLNADRIQSIEQALRVIAALPDPLGLVRTGYALQSGVQLRKLTVPLGVVFTIFESRPNVTIDIGALSLKSGNAAILRGGKEARYSNQSLHALFQQAILSVGLPGDSVQLITESDRAYMLACLQLDDLIDIVVPRGGEALIRFTAEHSRIPVIKHDKGVCNLYIDRAADPEKAIAIAINSKLQRPSVCNAIENLIIHTEYPHTQALLAKLATAGARLLGPADLARQYTDVSPIEADLLPTTYGTEFLDERLSVALVSHLDEALDFIDRYGSGHSEGIVTEDFSTAQRFQQGVDTAAILLNCSTRFHDGGQMGMGAEVGISTGRLHVRGPMGLQDLVSTTYVLEGHGEVRP
ncbi:MAG: glutamate-5-semialdehyde dehydrogenase [Leptospiraceae bacterium]|nr:glutamate-5-semialdehyde dehydrogenase [Leptospiraceae bacterium]